MSESSTGNSAEGRTLRSTPGGEINLLDYLIVLMKRKWMIFTVTAITVGLAVVACFVLPKKYLGETRILPPVQSSSTLASQFLSQLGSLSGLLGGPTGPQNPSALYAGMIKSRTVLDSIIVRFRLKELYGEDKIEDVRKKLLEKNLDVSVDTDSGIITIGVLDKSPQRAADMANALVEELRKLTKGIAIGEAAQRRLFFEEQIKDTKLALTRAEDGMRKYQEGTGALQVEEQAKAVIEGIAILRAQIAAKEVELRVMRVYATSENPDVQRIEHELKGLKEQVSKQEAKGTIAHDPLMPTGRMPEVGLEYLRKMRDIKYNETLYELLTKQYEMAKIDEAREAAVIQVIDSAIPPDKEAQPNKLLIIAIGLALGLFSSISWAFFAQYKEKALTDPSTKERFEMIKQYTRIRRRRVK